MSKQTQKTKQTKLKKENVVPVIVIGATGLLGFLIGRKVGRQQGCTAFFGALLNTDPDLAVKSYKVLNDASKNLLQ